MKTIDILKNKYIEKIKEKILTYKKHKEDLLLVTQLLDGLI